MFLVRPEIYSEYFRLFFHFLFAVSSILDGCWRTIMGAGRQMESSYFNGDCSEFSYSLDLGYCSYICGKT